MKTDYIKKGLAIGVIVLFVCVGISSAVAIKGVKINNNDIINSSNVVSTEDLPDLKIVIIDYDYVFYEPWDDDKCHTIVGIKNIGDAALNGSVNIKIYLYGGIGPSSYLIELYQYHFQRLDIASGDLGGFKFIEYRSPPDDLFLKIVVYVNCDENVKESNYRNNVAEQKFYKSYFFWYMFFDWIKLGRISYPLLIPHQLGI